MQKNCSHLRNTLQGFTLIEMLIVIVIIGLLAFMAVSSFGSAQKAARLDIAVDTIMSVIKEQQGKARAGRQVSGVPGGKNLCYGVVFQKSFPSVQTVTVPYVAVSPNSAHADYCDVADLTVKPVLTPAAVSADIVFQKILQGGSDVTSSGLVLVFKPPFGAILQSDSVDHIQPDAVVNQSAVQIFLNQGGSNSQDQRVIQFDPLTGTVSRVNSQSQPHLPSLP